jgi:tetratricopeptide (TPR) repeat protein/capsular polysaccharide biosynthesis protein
LRLQLHELHYNLGYLLHQQGNLSDAIEHYRHSLAAHPGYALAHYGLGIAFDEQGQYENSIAHYQKAIALNPENASIYNNLGCVLAKQDQVEQAIQVYQQGLERQPGLAELHNNLGKALFSQDPDAAIRAFCHAIELQPNSTTAYLNLGNIYQQYGQHQAAVGAFEQVLSVDPTHSLAWSGCGIAWMNQHKIAQALHCFRQAIAPVQAAIEAYCDWALQLKKSDELTQARIACAHFLRALSRGDVALAQDYLAQTYAYWGNVLLIYGEQAQFQQAESYFQQAIQLQPQNLQLHLHLADCLIQQKRFDAAILVYHAAQSIHGKHPALFSRLGLLFEQRQQFERSIDYYRAAIQQQSVTSTELSLKVPIRHNFDALNSQTPTFPNPVQGWYPSVLAWLEANHLVEDHFTPLITQPAAISLAPASQGTPERQRCTGLNCIPCLREITQAFLPIHLGQGLFRFGGEEIPVQTVPKFTASVPNGQVWAVPQQNDWLICNAIGILSPDDYLLADVSRDYPGQLPPCQQFDPKRHRIFSETQFPPLQTIQGRVAVLAGLSGHNYFHWMIDILPRLEILRRSGIEFDQVDWFYVNQAGSKFQQATLEKLGISIDRVLASDRYPYLQATELIVPSFAGHLGWAEPWMLDFLRQEFLPIAAKHFQGHTAFPKRLYISRAKAHHRRVLNERAVLDLLDQFGFVTVELEALSFAEQIALFAQAEVIVAPHGGGLTNLIFCDRGTRVLELFSPNYVRHYYWVISQALSLEHWFMTGEPFPSAPIQQLMYPSPLTEDIWIDIPALQTAMQKIGV